MEDKKRKLFDEKMGLEDSTPTSMEDSSAIPQHHLLEESEVELARPPMYEVVMLNDDFTPMDYVVFILKRFFHKNHDEATELTLTVHNSGQGICGTYTREVAETKISQVIELSRKNKHPLKCVMRKVFH
jgi:ATP-dependent Clp protease adaptor protein ClpS